MSNEAPRAVGIFLRVSTEDQVKGESLEHHEARARQYADLRGWTVAKVYRLDAVSGKSVIGHPEAKRMLADVRSGAITGLVFSKLARLGRNTRELLEIADVFRACNADLISLAESIDTSSPAGRMFYAVIAAMGQWEREELVSRVRASIKTRAQLGKPLGGTAPYGYRWVNKKLEPDPQEAPIRVLAHELFLAHRRKKTVARILNERGYRTRSGAPFSDTTISRLIQDTTAKGVHRGNYTRVDEHSGNWTRKPEEEWVYTAVEPIVSVELWEQCAAIDNAQRRHLKPVARKSPHLFTGFAQCQCGAKMYAGSRAAKYICNACHNKIAMDDLEAIYRAELTNFLVSPEEIAGHEAAAEEALRDCEKLLATAQTELGTIKTENDELYELYHLGAIDVAEFKRRHRPLADRRAQLEDELPRLQAQADVLRITMLSRKEALGEAQSLATQWEELPMEQRRGIVETITDRIVVGAEDISISLLYLPSGNPAELATQGGGLRGLGAKPV